MASSRNAIRQFVFAFFSFIFCSHPLRILSNRKVRTQEFLIPFTAFFVRRQTQTGAGQQRFFFFLRSDLNDSIYSEVRKPKYSVAMLSPCLSIVESSLKNSCGSGDELFGFHLNLTSTQAYSRTV